MKSRLVLAAVAMFLLGCAGASSAQIGQRVTLDSAIPQPEIPFIQGPGSFKAYLIGGGVGAAIDQHEAGKLFRDYMRKNNIDISKIVFESFRRVILEDNLFALTDASDTRLKLVINTYGFGHSGFFAGNERRPMINITASLVSNGTNVVWKKTDYITNLSKLTTAYTYDQLAENPQLTVKSFEQVSTLLSRQILSDLKK